MRGHLPLRDSFSEGRKPGGRGAVRATHRFTKRFRGEEKALISASPPSRDRGWLATYKYEVARRVLGPALIVAAWVGVTEAGLVGGIFLPKASALWHAFRGMESTYPQALLSSVTMTLTGFALGTLLGIGLGLGMAYSRIARELLGGVIDFIRPVPVFAMIPLFVLWFGIGRTPQIALITLGTSVILGVTTLEAVRNVPTVYIRAALTLGASRWTVYRSVIVPWILPHLLGAIRVAAAASWGLDVAAEFIGAQSGLGYLMVVRESYLDTASLIDIVITYSILAVLLDLLIRNAQRPLTRWTERQSARGIVGTIIGAR
ncbi:MAG: ABC transporter permease [Armatimonadetes bacterium]|nr:ABC transporter permease [Armatimonadota bacterium]